MNLEKVIIKSQVNEAFARTIVTQELLNDSSQPAEFSTHYYNYNRGLLFSSFNVQIGESLKVSSKVIKENKAEEKYIDAISSGNAAILTTTDKKDKNKIITHIGNIPPKQKVTFVSEFIELIDSTNNYHEFKLFDFNNLPMLYTYEDDKINYNIIEYETEIKTQTKIDKIEKREITDKLIIKEENFDQEKNLFKIIFEYKRNENYNDKLLDDFDYMSLYENKICFKLNLNYNIILFSQSSIKNKNEQNFLLKYRINEENNDKNKIEENLKLNPALFILLINKSFFEQKVNEVIEAFHLFFHSIPAGSYYQIISDFSPYDNIPKEYNLENITESLSMIKNVHNIKNKTENNLLEQLKYIDNCKNQYDKISLPKNIFVFTNEEYNNEIDILNLIEKLSKDFSIHSFGNKSNENFIKKAGIIGKENYTIIESDDKINKIIINELNNISIPFIYNFNINSELDDIILNKINNLNEIMSPNITYNFDYITKEKIDNKKIFNFVIKYNQNRKDFILRYKLEYIELPSGEDLSKLIIYDYILNNKDLSEEERIKLAINYQIFMEGTSLFAEAELSEKIVTPMIFHKGNQINDDNNIEDHPILDINYGPIREEVDDDLDAKLRDINNNNNIINDSIEKSNKYNEPQKDDQQKNIGTSSNNLKNNEDNFDEMLLGPYSNLNDSVKQNQVIKESQDDQQKNIGASSNSLEYGEDLDKMLRSLNKINDSQNEKQNDQANDVEEINNFIYLQNILEGFWDINSKTLFVKNKYKNEFDLLKKINIDDITAITILVIYYLRKDYLFEIYDEYIMILKKAQLFIKNKTGYSYENIIKKAGFE